MQKCIKRGQVWFYKPSVVSSGSIQRGPRPVIIVSNDVLNRTSSVVLGVPCTTQIKRNFPTHSLFIMKGRVSVALTEQIMPVSVDELTTLEYILEDYVMHQIDEALLAAVGLSSNIPGVAPTAHHTPAPAATPPANTPPVDNPVDNVDKKPIGNQVGKFYNKYPQLTPPSRLRKSRWTEQTIKQLIDDFDSGFGKEFLEKKYGLTYQTLRKYYYKYRDGGK